MYHCNYLYTVAADWVDLPLLRTRPKNVFSQLTYVYLELHNMNNTLKPSRTFSGLLITTYLKINMSS